MASDLEIEPPVSPLRIRASRRVASDYAGLRARSMASSASAM